MNINLIIFDSSVISLSVLVERMKQFGEHYILDDGQVLLNTTKSAQDIYNALSEGDFKTSTIVVFKLYNTAGQGYWGRTNKSLWDWLRSK